MYLYIIILCIIKNNCDIKFARKVVYNDIQKYIKKSKQ